MKLTAILLFLFCLQVSANSFGQISLNEKNAPLEKVLKQIKKQSGLALVYEDQLLQKAKPVDIVVSNATVDNALALIFKNQPLTYEIVANQIITVKERKAEKKSIEVAVVESQPIDIKGKVVDEQGKPIPGVSVFIRGTNKVVVTNDNGEFTITEVDGATSLFFAASTCNR